MARLLAELARLQVWGHPVITDDVVDRGFDILRLVRTQRERCSALRAAERPSGKSAVAARPRMLERARGARAPPASARRTLRRPAAQRRRLWRRRKVVATGRRPALRRRPPLLRYRGLRQLPRRAQKLYARELPVVDLHSVRGPSWGGR